MLLRMIQNWPKLERLTVMNSGVGYNLINERHDEIKRHVQIIIHGWSYGVNDCGLMFEMGLAVCNTGAFIFYAFFVLSDYQCILFKLLQQKHDIA